MRRVLVALATMLATLPMLAVPTGAAGSSPEGERPPPRIINGQEVDPPGTYPFMVAIVQRGNDSFNGQYCGGSLISETWVLSAAHCFVGESASNVEVVIGRHDLTSNAGVRIGARSIVIHPDYNDRTTNNDVALVELSQPYSGETIALPPDASFETPGRTATAIGWGNTEANRSKAARANWPTNLQEVDLRLGSNDDCRAHYGSDYRANTMLCAGGAGFDTCQGDSGGPLFITTAGGWTQVGITSWGDGCGQSWPGIYTRVSTFVPWVTQVSGVEPGEGSSGGGGDTEGVFCAGRQTTIVGTGGDDFLIGTFERDVIAGLGGNDTIQGLGGNDVICGDAGDDDIDGGGGSDLILGGSGNDELRGGAGNDKLKGQKGDDELSGDEGRDRVIGNGGSDHLLGGEGDDVLRGGGGADTLIGTPGYDVDDGGGGRDECEESDDEFTGCETVGDLIGDGDGGVDGNGAGLDPSLPAFFRSPQLSSGFEPDPWTRAAVAGGSVDVTYLGGGCIGFAAQAPDFQLTWSGGGSMLRFYFVADYGDATLIVRDPSGAWNCNDDWGPFVTLDPGVEFDNPADGVYDIWIGSYWEGDFPSGRFSITERGSCDPLSPC